LELGDLVQAGILGLVNAARSYDPTAGVSLAFYAQYRIRGEMLDTLRGLDGVSRQLRRFDKRMKAVRTELTGRLQREPTEEEILCELGLPRHQVRETSTILAMTRPAHATN